GSVRLPCGPEDLVAMYFASPTVVRIAVRSLRLFEFDVTHRVLQQTGALPIASRYVFVRANEDGSRLVVLHPKGTYVVDGRTAAVQMEVPGVRMVTLLHDGGVAAVRDVSVEVMDARGNIVRRIATRSTVTSPAEELRDGRLLYSRRDRSWNVIATVIIDPA